jgi:uncharacterized glyoxalase superfamily protein PhnB
MDAVHGIAYVIPTLSYRDAAAALDWLCEAFGFERHAVCRRALQPCVRT